MSQCVSMLCLDEVREIAFTPAPPSNRDHEPLISRCALIKTGVNCKCDCLKWTDDWNNLHRGKQWGNSVSVYQCLLCKKTINLWLNKQQPIHIPPISELEQVDSFNWYVEKEWQWKFGRDNTRPCIWQLRRQGFTLSTIKLKSKFYN